MIERILEVLCWVLVGIYAALLLEGIADAHDRDADCRPFRGEPWFALACDDGNACTVDDICTRNPQATGLHKGHCRGQSVGGCPPGERCVTAHVHNEDYGTCVHRITLEEALAITRERCPIMQANGTWCWSLDDWAAGKRGLP